MAMLNETKPKFAIRQVVQDASQFNILEGQGLAKRLLGCEKGKG